jgi:hypothetical protein
VSMQDHSAGIGHRAHEWITALWLALTFNLTLVHQPVDSAAPGVRTEHGAYAGWDAFLGLGFGERPAELGSPPVGQHIRLPVLKGWNAPAAEVRRAWEPLLSPREAACNVMFHAQGDFFVVDISAAVRPFVTWKFAAAAAARARAGAQLPLRYSPSAVNVAVHFRVGDAKPTPEAALWAEAQLVLLQLRAAGVKSALHVHVFTDGPVPLTHFGRAALPGEEGAGGGVVRVHHHSDAAANETMWHFANADVFVGSQSAFSALAGLASPRFLGLMQWIQQAYCPDGGVSMCCANDGVCEDPGRALLERAARRVAAAEACGNIGPRTAAFSETWPLESAESVRGRHSAS